LRKIDAHNLQRSHASDVDQRVHGNAGKQDELIELLTDVTEQNVRHHQGFVSASLHRGIDGRKVTMYAQWASVDDYEAMR
jgi:hypothetical protein